MNVLQINASDSLIGGASRLAMDLLQGLELQEHHVEMFVGKKFGKRELIYQIPKNIWRKSASFILANDIDFFKTNYITNTQAFQRADIIQCHNLHGWYFNLSSLVEMSKQKPVVWTLHDMWPVTAHCGYAIGGELSGGFYQCPNLNIYPSLLWHNEKYLTKRKKGIYQEADFTLVAPSLWLKDIIGNSVLKDKPIKHIPNGIDNKIFRPLDKISARQELGLPQDKKIILFLSSMGKDNIFKGWQYYEEVAKCHLADPAVIFLCLGNSRDKIEGQLPNIDFRGKIADKALLAKYYSAADLLLFTSLADNFPLVILEAMACGLPIVSFDVGGVKEAVTHMENGYIAKYQDKQDLLEGLRFILDLPDTQRQAMADCSVAKVREKYTIEIMTKAYLRLYQELTNK